MQKTILILTCVFLCSLGFAAKSSRYQALLVPLDLYSPPPGKFNSFSRKSLVGRIIKRGLPVKIASQDLNTAKETYELGYDSFNLPRTVVSASYSHSQNEASTPYRAKSYSFGLGLTGDLGWGLQYSFSLPRVTTTNYEYATSTSDSTTTTLGMGVTLPLIRGSLFTLGRNQKNQLDASFDIAKAQMRQTALQTILLAEQTYFTLLQRLARVRVLERALESARAFQLDVSELVKVGESERLSLVKVELQVAQTENDLLTAQAELETSRQALRDLLALTPSENIDIMADPTELRGDLVTKVPELANAIDTAKKNRPDYMSALHSQRLAELGEQEAFSNMLPTLNLVSSYGYEKTRSSLATSFSDTLTLGAPTYSVGLELSYSIFNDSDKTNYRKARIAKQRADLSVTQIQNQINRELSAATQNVILGQKRLKTSLLARTLAENRLASEFEKFSVGESNIRNVIDFQTDLNTARISEINARADLAYQAAVLRTAMGELPPGFSFEVEND